MNSFNRYQHAKKATLCGALINVLLGVIKLIGGLTYHSHALIADGIHSFADLLTDIMVIIAAKWGSQDADASHPYGHQRIETAATLMLALMLAIAGVGIVWDALAELIRHQFDSPQWPALVIALASIIANEGLFHYTKRIAKQVQSSLLLANAWHHRSDAASSVVVFIGLIGSLAGYSYLDTIAALIVGFMIIKMAWEYGLNSVKELVDTAVDPATLVEIKATIKNLPGVQKVHQLRSRMMGADVFIDVHILVSPYISVSEGHYIAQHVHYHLIRLFAAIKDVTVHVDAEDDEMGCPSMHLPSRSQLESNWLRPWQIRFPMIDSWVLHFLEGKIEVDLLCKEPFNDWHECIEFIQKELRQQEVITRIQLLARKTFIKSPC